MVNAIAYCVFVVGEALVLEIGDIIDLALSEGCIEERIRYGNTHPDLGWVPSDTQYIPDIKLPEFSYLLREYIITDVYKCFPSYGETIRYEARCLGGEKHIVFFVLAKKRKYGVPVEVEFPPFMTKVFKLGHNEDFVSQSRSVCPNTHMIL